jgi:hypothetical protein
MTTRRAGGVKPRIRFSFALDAWCVIGGPVAPFTVHDTWREAMAMVGIRMPKRWWEHAAMDLTPGGENDYHDVPDDDLPGMWERADFMGGHEVTR